MIKNLYLLEDFKDSQSLTYFDFEHEVNTYINKYVNNRAATIDGYNYKVFTYKEAIENKDIAIFLLNGLFRILNKLIVPEPVFYRIYASNGGRYKALGSHYEQVDKLIYAVFFESKAEAGKAAITAAKYYKNVEVRACS